MDEDIVSELKALRDSATENYEKAHRQENYEKARFFIGKEIAFDEAIHVVLTDNLSRLEQ